MRRAKLVLILAASLAACTFSREVQIRSHVVLHTPTGGPISFYNLEERLALGYIPEVLDYFRKEGGGALDSTRAYRVLGQAMLEAGDFRGAAVRLERAHGEEGRFQKRAEAAWLVSQARYWLGDFPAAAYWARLAREAGHGVPTGWVAFLASGGTERPYGGSAAGTRLAVPFGFGHPDLPRLAAKINDHAGSVLILDTGASLSLLTESAAKRLGIEPVPDATAGAYGLHRVELTMRFGWAKSVQIGGVSFTHVPFGILPDDALTFRSASTAGFHFDGVLGVHFMKELDWRFEYGRRSLRAVRVDDAVARGSKDQNVFFRRLKPMVRGSFNQEGWFIFLLDTGSEPTMVTRAALGRSRTREFEGLAPITIEGIGKSRVSWGKMSHVSVGLDRFMVTFKDLVVKEEGEGLEDGVIGSSFLSNFDLELRFSAMTLKLERAGERLLREATEADIARPAGVL